MKNFSDNTKEDDSKNSKKNLKDISNIVTKTRGRGNHHVTATLVTTQAVLQAAPRWTCTEWVIYIAGIYVASSRQFS